MTKDKALFILEVLDLASDYHKRNDSDNVEAVKAAQKIADRYSELKRKLGFEEASIKAKSEFLMSYKI